VGEFKPAENLGGLVAVLVGEDGNAGGLATRIELAPDRRNLAPGAVI
jgi:hypothetical protein